MAKILGIEYAVFTLDGDTEAKVLLPPDYPVAFELVDDPEPWEVTVQRHKQEPEDDNRGEQ